MGGFLGSLLKKGAKAYGDKLKEGYKESWKNAGKPSQTPKGMGGPSSGPPAPPIAPTDPRAGGGINPMISSTKDPNAKKRMQQALDRF